MQQRTAVVTFFPCFLLKFDLQKKLCIIVVARTTILTCYLLLVTCVCIRAGCSGKILDEPQKISIIEINRTLTVSN